MRILELANNTSNLFRREELIGCIGTKDHFKFFIVCYVYMHVHVIMNRNSQYDCKFVPFSFFQFSVRERGEFSTDA